jgi:hypothetical protein
MPYKSKQFGISIMKRHYQTTLYIYKIHHFFYKIHQIIVTAIISTSSMILNTSTADAACLC